MLDHNNVPKLIDFGLCISIPQGQAHVEDAVIGRIGFSAPEYVTTGYLTEKADVYRFGMLLLDLLGGRKLTIVERNILDIDEKHCVEIFSNFMDPRMTIEAEQLMLVATLILRCTCVDGEKRPTMMEVAKHLKSFLNLVSLELLCFLCVYI
ncbi:hypothetical protein CXB51_034715 [Gossypium anomalum]|uniref:Protein kinase domain-containing protein n=1 Tax=Gossypium anomalum TaxID=47600 RepID=A0A8J5XQ30_9ROSI|nr:hypothetical protein CXB51_034715 [Gossypium anomalum]